MERGSSADTHIRSANDEYQLLQALLTNRKKRHRRGEFLVHGVRPITRAVAHGWSVRAFLSADRPGLSTWAADIIERAGAPPRYLLDDELFLRIAQKDDPSELVAVVRIAPRSLADLAVDGTAVICICEGIQSPGNLGTIIRSADAFGAAAVVVTGHAADPYDPQAVRASTGSVFAVPVVVVVSFADVTAWLSRVRTTIDIRLVGADETAPPLDAGSLRRPVAIAVGTESSGLSRGALESCEQLVSIPIGGDASSLNVATAASILLYETSRS